MKFDPTTKPLNEDKRDFFWCNDLSRQFLAKGYLLEGETAETRVRDMANRAEEILGFEGFAKKFYYYMSKGAYSIASPIWANFGRARGLPISCNGSLVEDTVQDIVAKNAEICMQTKNGAGTSAFFGKIRPRGAPISTGGFANGPFDFLKISDTNIDVFSQSNIRRGTLAAYINIEHDNAREILEDYREMGGELQNFNLGVTITDQWMKDMLEELRQFVVEGVPEAELEKLSLWLLVLRKRAETGYPYIVWHDAINRNKPDVYHDKNMIIWASNVCTEIALPASLDESFVCDLSSINVLHIEEIYETDAVEVLAMFLDAVMSEYIEKTEGLYGMENSHRFAKNHRAIGIGVLGYHSFLQSRMIAFESMEAKLHNTRIHKFIRERCDEASRQMAVLLGEPPLLKGYGRRNTTVMALAPTTSSSFIAGQVSQSIEPWKSNYMTKELAKGTFTVRNPYLAKLLEEKYGRNDEATWRSILEANGSCQHLSFLTQHERDVFKKFSEISQLEILQQGAARQRWLDQTQSLNLIVPSDATPQELHDLHVTAWDLGLPTVYYLHTDENSVQKANRNMLGCVACEA